MKKISEFTLHDDGSIDCGAIDYNCNDCPIRQFANKKGYNRSREFIKAKGLIMKIDPCTTVYHYAIKLEKLERILSLC